MKACIAAVGFVEIMMGCLRGFKPPTFGSGDQWSIFHKRTPDKFHRRAPNLSHICPTWKGEFVLWRATKTKVDRPLP